MLKNFVAICAALVVATAAFSAPAQAQRHGGGAHFSGVRVGGAHFGGARVGGFSGARIGGAGLASRGYAYRSATRSYAYRSAVGPGRYHPAYRYSYRHRGYRYGYYGGYWPYWGWGAFASDWPAYYDDYAYEAPSYDGDVAYCMQRFKSYDPVSRTYLGYDGYRHSCP
jgi:hypothetical protein